MAADRSRLPEVSSPPSWLEFSSFLLTLAAEADMISLITKRGVFSENQANFKLVEVEDRPPWSRFLETMIGQEQKWVSPRCSTHKLTARERTQILTRSLSDRTRPTRARKMNSAPSRTTRRARRWSPELPSDWAVTWEAGRCVEPPQKGRDCNEALITGHLNVVKMVLDNTRNKHTRVMLLNFRHLRDPW